MSLKALANKISQDLSDQILHSTIEHGELTLDVAPEKLKVLAVHLRDEPDYSFEILVDLSGIDYGTYGEAEWKTSKSTNTGFSRGVTELKMASQPEKRRFSNRFAVAYHLLSVRHNLRARLKVFAPNDDFPSVPSVVDVWESANWYEREAFDLYGIHFNGHPDLRRLLTDYGFIGHPFRKDFPLTGEVEVRYDKEKGRVIYQPTSIEPRVLVPRVIRDDHRYVKTDESTTDEKGA